MLSGGLLRATPHYVKAPGAAKTEEVSRETLAIFMQPRSVVTYYATDTKVTCACVPCARHLVDMLCGRQVCLKLGRAYYTAHVLQSSASTPGHFANTPKVTSQRPQLFPNEMHDGEASGFSTQCSLWCAQQNLCDHSHACVLASDNSLHYIH